MPPQVPGSDCLTISRWRLRVAIGVYPQEKKRRQPLWLTVKLWGDFRLAGRTDRLEDALDYAELKNRFEQFVAPRRWELLESFAEQAAEFFFTHPLLNAVEITLDKPQALAPALISYTCFRIKSTQ